MQQTAVNRGMAVLSCVEERSYKKRIGGKDSLAKWARRERHKEDRRVFLLPNSSDPRHRPNNHQLHSLDCMPACFRHRNDHAL